MALHRAKRQIEPACDLGVREVLEECQFHDAALWLAEPGELVDQQQSVDDGAGGFNEGFPIASRSESVHLAGISGLILPVIRDPAPGDRHEPSCQCALGSVEARSSAPSADEDRLRDVGRICLIPRCTKSHRVDKRRPAAVRLSEHLIVAAGESTRDEVVRVAQHARLPNVQRLQGAAIANRLRSSTAALPHPLSQGLLSDLPLPGALWMQRKHSAWCIQEWRGCGSRGMATYREWPWTKDQPMLSSRLARRTAISAAALVSVGLMASVPAANAADGTTSLAAVLTSTPQAFDTNHADYDILTAAILAVLKAKPDSPVKVLTDGGTALTAFIPTDQAFINLASSLSGKKVKTEAAAFAAVAGLGIPTVEKVLEYHVVPGPAITSADALKANGAKLSTALPGKTIGVKVVASPASITLLDYNKKLPDPKVILSQVDINKGNAQIAHGINAVLMPTK